VRFLLTCRLIKLMLGIFLRDQKNAYQIGYIEGKAFVQSFVQRVD